MSPFDFVKQILQGKKQLIVDDVTEKEYVPFLVNRSLSYHKDCVLFANEINQRHFIDKKMQNDFLLNTVRSQRRTFAKWLKPEKRENVDYIKILYNMSEAKAQEALRILPKEQLKELKGMADIGGMYMVDEEGQMVTRDVNAKFVNGKPAGLEATYTWKTTDDFERFMRFAERYAQANDLGFAQKKNEDAGEGDAN